MAHPTRSSNSYFLSSGNLQYNAMPTSRHAWPLESVPQISQVSMQMRDQERNQNCSNQEKQQNIQVNAELKASSEIASEMVGTESITCNKKVHFLSKPRVFQLTQLYLSRGCARFCFILTCWEIIFLYTVIPSFLTTQPQEGVLSHACFLLL